MNQGAKSGGELESAQAKNQALIDAGAVVPTSYEGLEDSIKEAFEKLVSSISLYIIYMRYDPPYHLKNCLTD